MSDELSQPDCVSVMKSAFTCCLYQNNFYSPPCTASNLS